MNWNQHERNKGIPMPLVFFDVVGVPEQVLFIWKRMLNNIGEADKNGMTSHYSRVLYQIDLLKADQ